MIDTNMVCCFYDTFNIKEEERFINDDRILKLFAAICWHYSCTGNDFSMYEVAHKDDLVDAILEHACVLKHVSYVYSKVQEIFESEESDEDII